MARFDPLKGEQKIVLSLSLFCDSFLGLFSIFVASLIVFICTGMLGGFVEDETLNNFKIWLLNIMFGGLEFWKDMELIFYAPEGVKVSFKLGEYKMISQDITASLNPLKSFIFVCSLISLIATSIVWITYKKVASIGVFGERNKIILRGGKKVKSEVLSDRIRQTNKASDLTVGQVPLIKETEFRHICISGDTGVGKSQSISQLLTQIRARGEKVFIYDASGDFTKYFYREGVDNLLAPFDDRSVNWTPFCEGNNTAEMERVASSFSPPGHDGDKQKHWDNAANLIFTSLLNEINKNPEISKTNKAVIDAITTKIKRLITDELGEDKIITESLLDKLLKGTLAQAVINENSPTHKSDVISTLVPKIRSLQYMLGLEKKRLFSIRDWVNNNEDKSWTFVRVNESQLELSQPLITAWVDTMVSNVLSRDASPTETLWLVMDETQGLGRINSLLKAVEKGRKYRFACIFSFTSHKKMEEIYGEKMVCALLSSLSTKLCFRYSDPDSSEWSSRLLGEQESIEGRTSMGRHRDTGITEQEEKRRDPLVMSTEIQNLLDLHCYLKLPGDLPIAKVETQYVKRAEIAPYWIERVIPDPVVKKEKIIDERTSSKKDGAKQKLKESTKPRLDQPII